MYCFYEKFLGGPGPRNFLWSQPKKEEREERRERKWKVFVYL
jgi:hypothetical protein